MGLLHDIQTAMCDDSAHLGSTLLKLRLLASRLGSYSLEEWVKYETEGYPNETPVPSYRLVGVAYTGTFYGPFGAGIKNAPIPGYLIEKFAGVQWTRYSVRESIAAIESMTSKSESDEGTFGIDAADLILALQGKVYEDYACNSVQGVISRGAMTGIQFVVRSRILELTIELERAVPEAVAIEFGNSAAAERSHSAEVSQISNQIIYGDVTNISSTGHGAHFAVAIHKGNPESLVSGLLGAGLPKEDAEEFSAIVASEDPGTPEEPMGERAKAWLLGNLRKATDGTWKVGVSVATKVLTEAVLKYYGLK